MRLKRRREYTVEIAQYPSLTFPYLNRICTRYFFSFFFNPFSSLLSFSLSLFLLFLFITRYNRETVRPLTFK